MPELLMIELLLAFLLLLLAGMTAFRKGFPIGKSPLTSRYRQHPASAGENELRNHLNRISDSIISLDREWRYTFLNDAALQTNPQGRESSLGKVIWDVHPEAKGTIFFEKAMEAMNSRQAVELEFFYVPLDSWFAIKMYPSDDGLTIFRRDITKQKKALEEVARKEKRFEAIIRHSSDGLALLTGDGVVFDMSPAGEKIMGYSCTRSAGYKWVDQVHPDDLPMVMESLHFSLLNPATVRTVEYRHIMAGGAVKWLECSLNNLLTEPCLNAIVVNFHDITERKNAAAAINAERILSDSIINSLPGIFYLFTREGKFLRWNENLEKVSGYGPDDILRMQPFDFVLASEREVVAEKIESVLRLGEDAVQLGLQPKLGEPIEYFFTGKSIFYEGEPCLVGVGIDFTEKLKTQEQIRKTTEQLRELAEHLQNIREEERTDIARDIHDDLGQQLTAVKIALYRFAEQVAGDPRANEAVQYILEMTGGAMESIRRISSRLRPAVLDDLGLVEAMKWQIEEFERRYAIPVTAEFADSGISDNIADPAVSTHLFRVFQEALTNIARHASASRVEVKCNTIGGNIHISVYDNGRGIDPQESRKKHRLGLLGIQERTSMMGGNFSIKSQPGKGTLIEIDIPAWKNEHLNAHSDR